MVNQKERLRIITEKQRAIQKEMNEKARKEYLTALNEEIEHTSSSLDDFAYKPYDFQEWDPYKHKLARWIKNGIRHITN